MKPWAKGGIMTKLRNSLALVAASLALNQAAWAQDAYRPATGTLLQIEADGSVKVAPDTMSVSASVVTTGATAAEALDRNNKLAGRLIQAVKASNIRIARLQTSDLEVRPRFAETKNQDDDDTPPRILGYVAHDTLEVELSEVAQAGNLISLMFEAGANEISGPQFSLRDPAPAQRKAEQAAIAAARAEADSYAAALGMKVSRVLRVSDTGFGDNDRNTIVVTGSRVAATPIEPGDVTYTATIHVEYLLEPR
jgi:uncharacterized protein YggE